MKNIHTTIQLLFLIIINIFVCTLDVIFYTNGLMDNLLFFIPLALLLTCLNYFLCNKTVHLIIIQSLTAISCFICTMISVFLYDKYISSNDALGFVVLFLFLFGQIGIFTYISCVAVFSKIFRIGKKQNS